ncbi:hypothetical protein RND81_09G156600 [Saponaria officinalis]|uniref:Pentatricopeptide repeat-containing protein n=1 Tax=Saponaria officinalis TaxID=3572 RepID=A0AAW1IMU5_SAPOF
MLVFKHLFFLYPPKINHKKSSISTISSLLNLCNNQHFLKQYHARFILHGHHQNPLLSSKLIEFYAKTGLYSHSLRVFDSILCPSFDLYNRVLQILAISGEFGKTLLFYDKMVSNFMYPDEFLYPFVVRSCREVIDVNLGRKIHGHLIKIGFDLNESVVDELVEFYDELGEFENARKLFDEMPERGLDCWNSAILNCLQNGHVDECFAVFNQMMEDNVRPNSVCVTNLLKASVEVKSLKLGIFVHGVIVVNGLSGGVDLGTALLTMYSKLGSLKNAVLVFEQMLEKNIIVWNLMISAYCRYGHLKKSVDFLREMISEGMKMDVFTALAVIPSIGELKSRQCGSQVHAYCIKNGLDSEILVQNSLIDMYCKVSACKKHPETRVAELAAEKLIALEPTNAGNYVLMSNIYAAAGKWDRVAKMRSVLRDRGLKKTPGCSWVEINGKMHEFRVADTSHPNSEDIYSILRFLEIEIEDVIKLSVLKPSVFDHEIAYQ